MKRSESLELDLDLRMTEVWGEVSPLLRRGRLTLGVFACALRVAYAMGYSAARRDGGGLFAEHGYTTLEVSE